MSITKATLTWTRNLASASEYIRFNWEKTVTNTGVKITVNFLDGGSTFTGSGSDLEYVRDQRWAALQNGITYYAYYNGEISGTRGTVRAGQYIIDASSYSKTITRTHSAQTGTFYIVFGTAQGAHYSISIPARTSYAVTYNANGGSGTTAAQTKWYAESLTLRTNSFTRTNYVFKRWNTKTTDNGTAYSAGATYTGNAALKLFAIWNPIIKYNANKGTGAPSNQTKTYGSALTLSSTVPTRTNHRFLGWGLSASETIATYQPGASYTEETAITLYAVWLRIYDSPAISIKSAYRSDDLGNPSDDGAYVTATVDWSIFDTESVDYGTNSATINIEIESTGASSTVTPTGFSGTTTVTLNAQLSTELSYTLTATIEDEKEGYIETEVVISAAFYPLDILHGGHGIAFGAPATQQDTAEVGFQTLQANDLKLKFNDTTAGSVDADLTDAITDIGWNTAVIESRTDPDTQLQIDLLNVKKLYTKILTLIDNLPDLFTTDSFTVFSSQSIAANSTKAQTTVNIAKTGYVPLAIRGIDLTSNSCTAYYWHITGNSLVVSVKNNSSSAVTCSCVAYIAYRKSI